MATSVTLTQARALVGASLKADTPIYLEGDPGIGKTSIVEVIGAEHKIPVPTLILSTCDQAEVGGVPGRDPATGRIIRLPLGPVRQACESPAILFLDEFDKAPVSVQGASLTLVLARWAGDFRLHPESRVILAGNPSDQGGQDLLLAMVGRITWLRVRPTLAEVQTFFSQLGPEGSTLRDLALDLSATWEASPDLVQIAPPPGHLARPAPWGAPRSWERALRLLSAIVEGGEAIEGDLAFAGLAGCVGEPLAGSYLAIRKIRKHLPTIQEIVKDPEGAKTPAPAPNGGLSTEEIASVGLVAQVALQDTCAAWIYGSRLGGEIIPVIGRTLLRYMMPGRNPRKVQAEKARARLLGSIGRDMASLGGGVA